MKDFVKMVLAVLCGLFILCMLSFFCFVGCVGSLAVSGNSKPVIPKSAVLRIDMSEFILGEQSSEEFSMPSLQSIQDGQTPTVGIWNAVSAINAAAEDDAGKYIYLLPEGGSTGMGHIYEFRTALEHFRASGKPIVAYMDNASTGGYYLASVADKVYMTSNEGSTPMFYGISGQLVFLKDLLDKLGVNVQLIRHGKYKSAGEMFVKNAASPENMQQNQEMIASIWNEFLRAICVSRDIPVEQLNDMVDNLKLNFAEDFLEAKLVDGLVSKEELKGKLADLFAVDDFKDVKMVSFGDYVSAKVSPNIKAKQKIAVVYADGDIVGGKDKQDVAGDRFAAILAKVRADSTVKAVVFRVNSPGGSVLASEQIKSEIDLMKKDKPVVASYGEYAASGGYWISNNCDKIYSDPVTLTGSIGVFSMVPDLGNTIKDLVHINMVSVTSNKHTDMYSGMRPLDKDELDYMQASVESIYERFVSTVSEGRGLEPDFVDSIAQGRVWAGTDALKIGLVDELGTLEDALKWAAAAGGDADLAAWNVAEYPKPLSQMEMMREMLGQKTSPENILAGTPFGEAAGVLLDWYGRVKDNPADVASPAYPISSISVRRE